MFRPPKRPKPISMLKLAEATYSVRVSPPFLEAGKFSGKFPSSSGEVSVVLSTGPAYPLTNPTPLAFPCQKVGCPCCSHRSGMELLSRRTVTILFHAACCPKESYQIRARLPVDVKPVASHNMRIILKEPWIHKISFIERLFKKDVKNITRTAGQRRLHS